MTDRVIIRNFKKDDEVSTINLLIQKRPPNERKEALEQRLKRWRWQYYNNPKNPDNKPLIFIAESGGHVVGMIGTIPVDLKTPLGRKSAFWGVDLIVDPRFRGYGIGKRLIGTWMDSSNIALGRGYTPAAYSIEVALGFKTLLGFTTATLVLSRTNFLYDLLKRKKYRYLTKAMVNLTRYKCIHKKNFPSAQIVDIIPKNTESLWKEVSKAYSFAIKRDIDYLTWRYLYHPVHQYNFVVLGNSNQPNGIAIVRLNKGEILLGIISDLIVDPNNIDLIHHLISESLDFFKSKGAHVVLIDLSPLLIPSVLKAYNCTIKRRLGMIIHTTDQKIEASGLLNPKHWYLSHSDSDADY